MKYRIDWMFVGAIKFGLNTYSKEEAEKLCTVLNAENAGISTHWVEPVIQELKVNGGTKND